jgi:hypothetical protein
MKTILIGPLTWCCGINIVTTLTLGNLTSQIRHRLKKKGGSR